MTVQRHECKHCRLVIQEHIHFADPQTGYTHRLAVYAVDLCRMASIKSVAAHLNLSWNTVKEMVKGYLQRHYSKPDISGLRVIGIDEFAVKKGHVYKTIVVDLETGRIVYVGEGKKADTLDGFRKAAEKAGNKIETWHPTSLPPTSPQSERTPPMRCMCSTTSMWSSSSTRLSTRCASASSSRSAAGRSERRRSTPRQDPPPWITQAEAVWSKAQSTSCSETERTSPNRRTSTDSMPLCS